MKKYLATVVLIAMAAVWFTGCKKDENQNFFYGGKAPVLTASKTNVVLTPATEKEEAIRFNWTNPQYEFSTGLSSHDVQYALEIDINTNFNSSKKYVTTISKDLSKSFTVFDFNRILGNNMQLPLDQDVTVYARVVSSLRFESAVNGAIASNAVTIRTKPYAPPPAVQPPSTNRLVLVGGASPGGWDNNANNGQVFTRVSNTLYEITINLTGGGSLLFLPVAGSWDVKYGFDGPNNSNNVNGDKLSMGGGDVKVPATTGRYKITVNFQNGTFTINPA
jgi:hypothetical protein